MSSAAAILFYFTASNFIPYESPSLLTGGDACEHPTAPFAKSGVCTRASCRGGNRVQRTGRSEGSGKGSESGVGTETETVSGARTGT